MLKKFREDNTSKKINFLEHQWWEENADIIERVWEMDYEISSKVRKNYINNARNFFKKGNQKVTILEIGCGSGWVGQMLAGANLHIIGTDFSKSQIALAKKNAKKRKLGKFTKYYVLDSSHWPKETQIDGILIHAFLHHLDNQEIEHLFLELKKRFKKGTKIWIYEPTFYRILRKKKIEISLETKLLLKIAVYFAVILEEIYNKKNILKKEKIEKFLELQQTAVKEEWYLSPKEIPFDLNEFSHKLKKYFRVENHYWATIYLIGWVAKINLIKNKLLKKIVTNLFLPLFILADKKICLEKDYLKSILVYPNYAFHVWECKI